MNSCDVSGDLAIARVSRGIAVVLMVICVFFAGPSNSTAQVVSSVQQSGTNDGPEGDINTVMTVPQLADRSETVVHGKVETVRSFWNEAETRIYSIATVTVMEIWKGESIGKTVEVRYPGGEVGTVGELYTHMPTFEADEEVVIFSKKSTDGTSRIVAGMQGKFIVSTGDDGVKKIGGAGIPLADLKKSVQAAARKN